MKLAISAAFALASILVVTTASAEPGRDDHHPMVRHAVHRPVCTVRHHRRVCR